MSNRYSPHTWRCRILRALRYLEAATCGEVRDAIGIELSDAEGGAISQNHAWRTALWYAVKRGEVVATGTHGHKRYALAADRGDV